MTTIPNNALVVLIGLSGAGKSTLAANNFAPEEIVSSDAIRGELFGDFRIQDNPGLVFQTFHQRIRDRLMAGLRVVADATSLTAKARRTIRECADGLDVPIFYLVYNRPLVEKLATAGWRAEVDGLIQRHHEKFESGLRDILRADMCRNVTVVDARVETFIVEK